MEPGFPAVLNLPAAKLPTLEKETRNPVAGAVLANWIASPKPMTARVFVNRVWQHHFGRGIVASTNDFGKFGTSPTHPELLVGSPTISCSTVGRLNGCTNSS